MQRVIWRARQGKSGCISTRLLHQCYRRTRRDPRKTTIKYHRGDRPKQKEKLFSLHTSSTGECVWVNLPWRKVWAYQLWKLKSVQPKSKTHITMVLYKHTPSLLQKRGFVGSNTCLFPCLLLSYLSTKPVYNSTTQSVEFRVRIRSLINLMASLNSYTVTVFSY